MSQEVKEVTNLIYSHHKKLFFGVSSQHWQLKDMLKIKENQLVYPKGCNVMSYDLSSNLTRTIFEDIEFFPTSICLKDSYLVVGGSRGNLKIRSLETGETTSQVVSSSINNNVCIVDNKIYICNNDRTLKVFTLDLQMHTSLHHVAQVNNCAISPDGRMLAVVGDSNDVFLYAIENESYRLVKKLKAVEDGGFSVSWNSTSSCFAVGTQDGYVCLWDVRSENLLHRFESKQKDTHRGAVRNVKFSVKNSLDLLFFTEHFSYVTVCDTRDFSRYQRIRVFQDKQITGAVFSEMNDRIYVSNDDQVVELEVNSKSRRTFAGL
jgi:WD40 repeat protein